MKTVEHQAEVIAIGGAHEVPGGGPVLDPASPRERFVADAHAPLAREIAEFRKVSGGALGIIDRVRGNIGAETQQTRAELVHEVELSRGAVEVPRPNGIGHRFEVSQRLQRDDFKPQIGGQKPRVARLAPEEGQIVLKDLNGAKACLGCGGKFVLQGAAHANGGDRPSEHQGIPLTVLNWSRR